jgi:hypothetical protein
MPAQRSAERSTAGRGGRRGLQVLQLEELVAVGYGTEQINNAAYFDYPRAMLQDLKWQPQQSHSATFSGGDQQSRYLLSGNYLKQEGLVINSGYQRFGARLTWTARSATGSASVRA